ncbi:hypothetical protein BSL78_24140 [Apostichopus japonicus]|uniref:Uncharacterized protein n=2 Tax=Stichopus japonicus TaxID=307972 RepID=A0A2G8JTD6_STIJA|nr:hypothetical protein BSL78_24140 [Apostichopus japonicus]
MMLERFRLNEPIGIRLNISVDVQENSEEIIGGTNLWRIAIYGSRDYYGDHENEKIGFNPQILDESDALHSPDIIPGRTLVFPLITTQFDLSAIGCGDYRYLCVTIAKSADSVPNFEISNNENKRKVVTCRIIRCINREPLPPPPTAWLRCLKWNVTNERVLEGKGYEVAFKVNIEPFNDTDTIYGTDLWRIGLFLSNATSGVMTRAQYQPDVLSEEDKAIPLIRGQNLLFTGLHGVLDVDGLGCPGVSLQYACLEFAKGESPSPYFYLPLGPSRAIIACKTINCHPISQATDD